MVKIADLQILTNLHVLSTLEYENGVYMRR
jgi:hypothetical protein